MDVGHSRLLKFLVKDKPKMEKHSLKIEDLAPTDIESEVPRHQNIREEPKVETSVQNPIEWTDLRDMIKKPVYMGIQEEVIKTQPIRPPKLTPPKVENPAARVEEHQKEDKTAPEEKPQTRIPVSRFKPAVERVQRERRKSNNADEQKRQAPEKPRRSSIPKLRVPVTRKNPTDDDPTAKTEKEPVNQPNNATPVKSIERKPLRRDRIPVMRKDHYKIVKREDSAQKQEEIPNSVQQELVQTDSNDKLDDEFDKLYDEIVDTDANSLPDEILEIKVKDSEKLESKFEEIVHQYDDESIEQVKIEPVDKARYSKIPLLRRRSSQDVKIPIQSDRKLALKIGDKTFKKDDEEFNNTKAKSNDDDSKPNGLRGDDIVKPSDNTADREALENSLEINNNDEDRVVIQSQNSIPAINTIPTPETERVKVGIFGMATREIPIEDNTYQNIDVATPVSETVKLAEMDIPVEDSLNSINSYVEMEETKTFDNIDTEIPINEVQNDTLNSLVEPELVENVDVVIFIDTSDIKTQNQTEVEVENGVEDPKNTITIPIIEDGATAQSTENQINKQLNMPLREPDDELKSVSLLQKVNTVEERTKSRFINKPINKKEDNPITATLEEEIPMVKGKVSRILKRLTSQELSNNDLINDNDTDFNKEQKHTNKIDDDIPKKKSVISKIAMFERAEPTPPVHMYSKLKRTISEEIRHSPKIVQEVLKHKGTEQPDKHTIGTVDIVKPVEVITNSEEQVTIVENLQEKTIEFENLNEKVDSAETIQNRLKELSVTQETISREDNLLYVAEPKESKDFRKISVTRDKVLDNVDTLGPQNTNFYIKPKETIFRDDRLKEPEGTRKISVTRNQILDDLDVTEPNYVNSDTNKLNVHQTISRNISVTRDEILEDDVNTQNELSEPNNNVNDKNEAIHSLREDNAERIPENMKSNDNRLDNMHDNYKKSNINDHYEPRDYITREHKLKDLKDDLNNIESIKSKLYKKEDKKAKWKSTDALADFVPVKEKINRLTSYDETNMKKAKSTAELDLGDAVKGKVKNMIVRMNSFDLLDDVKAKGSVEVINAKERPRKKSVLEKIALFERKLVPVAMEDAPINMGRSLNADKKPTNINANTINDGNGIRKPSAENGSIKPNNENGTKKPNVEYGTKRPIGDTNVTNTEVKTSLEAKIDTEDIAARIKELQDAKRKYGSVEMGSLELRDGRKMPVMALGTALLDPRLAKYIVAAAIDLGFRAIDTAYIYGTEREVGEGIRMKIQDGTVRREDLFIMSKLWSTFHKPELVEGACRASLAALGLEYFDLFMIHNPMSFKEGGDPIPKIANVLQYSSYEYLDAWYAMEDLVSKGLVRSIGVSNFNSVQVARVLEKGRVKPVVNQVECHPFLNQALLSEFCEARDVRLSCYSVLGSRGTPAQFKDNSMAAIDDAMIRVMAAALGVTPAQLLIRYQIDRGHNVVVKASSGAHLWDNLQALGVYLQPADLQRLNTLNRNRRTFTFKGMGDTHRNYPFSIAF